MRLDISDLRVFVNVVEGGSITRGAERSNRAVASISARIKDMETELETPLLQRIHNGVAPTEAGKKLLGYAYCVLREMQNMSDDLADYGKRVKGYVKLCCNSLALQEVLPDLVGVFLEENERISLSIEDVTNDLIAPAVLNGDSDIGIMAVPTDKMDLETYPFLIDRYVMVLPERFTLTGAGTRFAEYLDCEFLGPGRGSWMQTQLQQHALEYAKSLKTRVQVRSFSMTCALAARGLGVGIVPSLVARRLQPYLNFRIAELEDDWASLELVLCLRKRAELSADAAKLFDFLADAANSSHSTF